MNVSTQMLHLSWVNKHIDVAECSQSHYVILFIWKYHLCPVYIEIPYASMVSTKIYQTYLGTQNENQSFWLLNSIKELPVLVLNSFHLSISHLLYETWTATADMRENSTS